VEDLRVGEAHRGSVHESGHILVALSLGVAIDRMIKVELDDMPASLIAAGCGAAIATDFVGVHHTIHRMHCVD